MSCGAGRLNLAECKPSDAKIIVEKIDDATYRIKNRIYKYAATDDSDEKMYLHNPENIAMGSEHIPSLIINDKTGIAVADYDDFGFLCHSENRKLAKNDELFEPEIYDCADFCKTFPNCYEQQDGWFISKDTFGGYNIRNRHKPDWFTGFFFKSWGNMIDGAFHYGSPTAQQEGTHWIYIDRENKTATYQIRDHESRALVSETVCHQK
jgi:hypothetical protein